MVVRSNINLKESAWHMSLPMRILVSLETSLGARIESDIWGSYNNQEVRRNSSHTTIMLIVLLWTLWPSVMQEQGRYLYPKLASMVES